jgi:hypothetical protein
MLTISDSPAFKRALDKARDPQTMPQVTEIEPNWQYQVVGSEGNLYQVVFSLLSGKLAASCTCPAHTGEDKKTHQPAPADYIPKDCYHIARCYDFRREQAALAAEERAYASKGIVELKPVCYWCEGGVKDIATRGPLVIARGYMEHTSCSPDIDQFQFVPAVPYVPDEVVLCDECGVEIATIEGTICKPCFDYIYYSDLAH